MNRWWFRVPIALGCTLMVAMAVVSGKIAYAVSGMPEFGEVLSEATTAFVAYLDWLLQVLELVW